MNELIRNLPNNSPISEDNLNKGNNSNNGYNRIFIYSLTKRNNLLYFILRKLLN